MRSYFHGGSGVSSIGAVRYPRWVGHAHAAAFRFVWFGCMVRAVLQSKFVVSDWVMKSGVSSIGAVRYPRWVGHAHATALRFVWFGCMVRAVLQSKFVVSDWVMK